MLSDSDDEQEKNESQRDRLDDDRRAKQCRRKSISVVDETRSSPITGRSRPEQTLIVDDDSEENGRRNLSKDLHHTIL